MLLEFVLACALFGGCVISTGKADGQVCLWD